MLKDLPFLLPTPTTQDSANTAGPAQMRRNSLPLNTVAKLLPTPTHQQHARRATVRKDDWLSHPGVTLLDALWGLEDRTEPGEITDQQSDVGNPSSDEQPPDQLTLGDG